MRRTKGTKKKIKVNKQYLIFLMLLLTYISFLSPQTKEIEAANFNYVMGTTDYGQPTNPQPAQWESYIDPFFNTRIRRISDISNIPGATHIRLDYTVKTKLNSDGRYLLVYVEGSTPGSNPYWVYDLENQTVRVAPHATGRPYANNGGYDAQPDYSWDQSGNHPTWIYYRDGTKFYRGDVTYPEGQPNHPNYNILLHDFAKEFPGAQLAYFAHDSEEGSNDGRYFAFIIRDPWTGPTDTARAIISYDRVNDRILGTLINPPLPGGVSVSPDGKHVVIRNNGRQGGAGSNFDGPHAWNLDLSTNPAPRKLARDRRHHGFAYDTNGNAGFIQMNDSLCGNDWMCFTNLQTGEYFPIINQRDLGWSGHHFARMYNINTKGWILVETYGAEGAWCENQVWMIEVKPSTENPRIWRIAHTQNDRSVGSGDTSQYASAISMNSRKIYFASNWRGTDNREVYEVTLPEKWWCDLSDQPEEACVAPSPPTNLRIVK